MMKKLDKDRIDFWNWDDEEIDGLETIDYIDREHGKCVRIAWESYCNVYIYEDGYEERISIGD